MNPSIACKPEPELKKTMRQTLLKARLEAARKPVGNQALGRRVLDVLRRFEPTSVGFYWPLEGEFDARAPISIWLAGDVARVAALPVIKTRHAPLEFHAWTPDMPMRVGHHRIEEPTSDLVVIPDLLFVPCVGFDADGYRLGYGGGYYDRTLAAWPGAKRPVTVGIAYEACRAPSLHRESHDIALDAVITDSAWYPLDPA
ncbi:5-formyltetrahydrofolate cyclo-ligase [Paraburkholderia sp.]|uniref:5-formyltetrahydrofolate cyclo-ligase n=1 Tax=Paraburkholderia sp. TaxID=1926495 RepID=UPI002392D9D5|nr:5-formyltetrahydrofolate cyclo-ligase [Paraburkholderia sp.]MDE1181181.1 5-formyltetrahydrofolate cyclo-ligase [Paraburkholderia sp.]